MSRIRLSAALACSVIASLAMAAGANAAVITTTIDYGPFTIPAGGGDPHDHDTMGQIENRLITNVARPCTNCTIVAMRPDLVYTDGSNANLNTGPMLHHAVWAATGGGKSDATCSSSPLGSLGERFFASGNERTQVNFTSVPYGYKVGGSSERWNMIVDLMNWQTTSKTVRVRVTYTYATGGDSTSRAGVRPVWLDLDQCGDSEVSVPNGPSDSHYNWTVNVAGRAILAAGHIHDHGIRIELTNESAGGASICNSVAGYGESPGYITPDGRSHISSMSTCLGNPITTLSSGQVVRLHALYDVPATHHPIDDAMGIALLYVNPS